MWDFAFKCLIGQVIVLFIMIVTWMSIPAWFRRAMIRGRIFAVSVLWAMIFITAVAALSFMNTVTIACTSSMLGWIFLKAQSYRQPWRETPRLPFYRRRYKTYKHTYNT